MHPLVHRLPGASRQLLRLRSVNMAANSSALNVHRPIILFDIMDTVVHDPFYTHMAPHFNMSFEELLKAKHPNMWVEFETGMITDTELYENFFSDKRPVDGEKLIQCMIDAYKYIEGMEELLKRLAEADFEIHACSNYPVWYRNIEQKLQLSKYNMNWTFISCEGPMKGFRKPSPEAFAAVVDYFNQPPNSLLFIDDRQVNVDAATAAGLQAIRFENKEQLEKALRDFNLHF